MSGAAFGPRTRVEDLTHRELTARAMWWSQPATGPSTRPTNVAFTAGPINGTYRSMDDVVTPGYKLRSSRGEIFNSPMSSQRIEMRIEAATGPYFRFNYPTGASDNGEIEGVMLGGYAPSNVSDVLLNLDSWCQAAGLVPDLARMKALASTQARAAVASSDFQGLVSLGELRETLSYLRNPFKTGIALADRLNSKIARMRPSRGGRLDGDIASLYLEFRYAVRPLVKEVESALLTLDKEPVRPKRQTARGKQAHNATATISHLARSFSGILADVNIYVEREDLVRGGLLYENVVDTGFNTQWGMRLSDLPSAAWELLPLSFVYDWVGNVGDYIGAITPKAGTRPLATWLTQSTTIKATVTGSNYRLPVVGWNTVRAGAAQVRYELRTRSRIPGLPDAQLAVRGIDTLRNDALRLLDLIGIFGQRLGSVANNSVVRQNERDRMELWSKRMQRRSTSRTSGTRASSGKDAELSWGNPS